MVDRSLEPKPGDVIIAVLEGEFTVKRFVKEGGKYYLKPENKKYKPVLLHADMDSVRRTTEPDNPAMRRHTGKRWYRPDENPGQTGHMGTSPVVPGGSKNGSKLDK